MFGPIWYSGVKEKNNSVNQKAKFALTAMLRNTQVAFLQIWSQFPIGIAVSENKIKEKIYETTDDNGYKMMTIHHLALWAMVRSA